MKPPAFQFYAADFLVGTATMSAAAVGAYIRLLCYQWDTGGIPDDDSTLCRLAGCDGLAVAEARLKFTKVDGLLKNERLEHERQKQAHYRQKQAENGAKRWVGNAKPQGLAMPTHMPNACSLSPSPSSKNTKTAASPVLLPFDSDAFRSAWSDWQQHRTEKREKLTPTSTKAQLSALAKMGEQRAIAAIRHTIFKGWTGIREPDQRDAAQFQRTAPKRESPECPGWKTILNHEFPDSVYSAGQKNEAHEWEDLPGEAQQLCWQTYKKQGVA